MVTIGSNRRRCKLSSTRMAPKPRPRFSRSSYHTMGSGRSQPVSVPSTRKKGRRLAANPGWKRPSQAGLRASSVKAKKAPLRRKAADMRSLSRMNNPMTVGTAVMARPGGRATLSSMSLPGKRLIVS